MSTVPHRRTPGRTTFRRLRWFAGLLALTLCVGLTPAVPAAAQVNWEEQQFRDRLFSAHMRAHDNGLQGLKDLVLSVAAMDWRVANPYATTEDITRHMVRVKAAIDAQYIADVYGSGAYAAFVKIIDAASGVPGVSIATPGLKALLESTVGDNLAQTALIENQVTGAYQTNMYLSQYYGVQDTGWGQVTRLGQQDPAFTAAWNGMIGGRTGVVLDASMEQLLADPLLATFINVESILERQQDQGAYLQEIRRQVEATLTTLSAKNDQIVAQLRAASLQYPVGPGPKPTPEAYTQARAQAAERQVGLDAMGSGLFVLSTLAGFVDPELGKDIATIGKAGLSIATAINNYLPTIAGLSVGQAMSSLSTMALTGNILGAVMTILPMFASGPTPDQIILQQMKELRMDIANLRDQMNERFDAIEQALVIVYRDITTQLARLEGRIEDVRIQLDDVQRTLLALDSKVDTLALFTAHSLQQASLDQLQSDVNGYINYEKRTNTPFPSYEKYGEVENTFHTAGTVKSWDVPFVQTAAGDKVDPVTTIGQFGPSGSVSYLTWLANFRYGTGVPTPARTVPSASVFQLASRAYMALQLQNPVYAGQMSAYRSNELQGIGNEYLAATRSLSTPAAGGAPNNTFVGLVTDYKTHSSAVSDALLEIRNRVSSTVYSPFGGPDQTPGTRITDATVPVCTGTGSGLSAPANAANASLPNPYQVAPLALPDDGKPKYTSCWTASWVDTDGDPLESLSGSVEITFVNRVEWPGEAPRDIRKVTAKRYFGQICTYNAKLGSKCKVPRDEVKNAWTSTYKPFMEQSGAVAVDQAALDDVRKRVSSALYGKQMYYYQVVRAELAGDTVLSRANRKLTETIGLIQTYTELAFPKALEGNATLNALLYGNQRLIGDQVVSLPNRPDALRLPGVSDAFGRALAAFAGCQPASTGRPCQPAFTPNVKADQAAPFNVDCPVADPVGEHVANCLAGYRQPRADLLTAQYARHSKELADGAYVEGSPQVEAILAELRAVNEILHRSNPVSQGRPATSSSVEVENYGLDARYAFDGDSTTRWSSKYTDSEWLQVDLGSVQPVRRIVLEWEVAYSRKFEIQTSSDGTTWTTIYSTASGPGGTQALAVNGTGRYVRLSSTQRGTQYGNSLWEFKVYSA
ncbi:discoidin domain-containing protein [Dactylosporangium sp. NPDC049742]|uniref:discoidin domain-containing protein n=1 Tax=Dactylosporangium sp. NPDC049742 TaxID=3154737 RepID=UPI0034483FE6